MNDYRSVASFTKRLAVCEHSRHNRDRNLPRKKYYEHHGKLKKNEINNPEEKLIEWQKNKTKKDDGPLKDEKMNNGT